MHLKSLELVGFKSFLNKTKIKFEPGVTAVVGPNGCGKSNVVDAIKWVLGEQSPKSMRSSAMQDVIFNGTDKQAPVNMAEVSITLSNEDRSLPVDYDEVTISRRLHRSGESEYLLNKTQVRLKDVKDILYGTGIGTSSYSVVEQGRMDMILSSKPEERRHIFEEASGITKYRAQKREAVLKLERTQDNLTRINDIIREISRQINSIERQARKAERYKARFEELKDIDVKLSYARYMGLGTDDDTMGEEDHRLREKALALQEKVEECSALLSANREEFSAVIEDLQVSQAELSSMESEIDKNRHVAAVNGERIQELEKTVQRLDWEIEEATERKEEMSKRLDALKVRFSEVSSRCGRKEKDLAGAEEDIRRIAEETDLHRHEVQVNRNRTVDLASEQTRARNAMIKIEADIHNSQARQKRLEKEKRSLLSEKQRVEEEYGAISARASEIENELEDKKNETRAFAGEFGQKQQEFSALREEKRAKESRLNEVRPRRQFLEKLVSEREGINEGVKRVLDLAEQGDERFKGVKGLLSELITVKDGYGEALETVMGDIAQSIVVEDRSSASLVMGYLEENSMGSVTFMILDELESIGDWKVPDGSSFRDIETVLNSDPRYACALRKLIEGTFVSSSEGAESFISNNHSFTGRAICPDGEVVRRGFRRSRNFSGEEVVSLFARKEKAQKLRQEEESLEKELGNLTSSLKEMELWLRESASQKEKLEADLRDKHIEFAGISSKKNSTGEKLSNLEEEMRLVEADISEERQSVDSLEQEKTSMESRVSSIEEEAVKLQCLIEESQKVMQESSRRREEAMYRVSDLKAELSALKKEEENLSDNLKREQEVLDRMAGEVEEKRSRVSGSGDRIRSLKKEIEDITVNNRELEAEREVKKAAIEERQRAKDRLSGDIHLREEVLKQNERELEDVRNKVRDMDVRKTEVEYKRSALVERIKENYKIDITAVGIEPEEDMDLAAAEAKVKELKEQLEKMGDVSLGAVEEHKELQERYEFLSKQHDDLVTAREELLKAITKINRTTRKMFIETFENIRREFNVYFRMLFNGGKAELVLQDESNILESGIDIIVRPPGKKLHNIMQLSGGEKAMTAIALIFAIFKVNPSPFCMLDEIDAPLDESNIVRFCNVLKEFLKLSQFVIVTHNRMTIQLADVLYGVTMQEKGVSRVVSVKFAEDGIGDIQKEKEPVAA
ncbi:MAG: chromosome segregation protein SMC [Candidatus Omnitrophica bacterium]|nr:chromosome segregation protein SMC [Candidatus Omnitrophota bacterium]